MTKSKKPKPPDPLTMPEAEFERTMRRALQTKLDASASKPKPKRQPRKK